MLGLGTRTITIAVSYYVCSCSWVFLPYEVVADDLLYSVLFISLPHRRIRMFSEEVGGEECQRIGGVGDVGVVGGGEISGGKWALDSSHALCLLCTDVSSSRLCALCCVPLSCWLYWFALFIPSVLFHAPSPLAVQRPELDRVPHSINKISKGTCLNWLVMIKSHYLSLAQLYRWSGLMLCPNRPASPRCASHRRSQV